MMAQRLARWNWRSGGPRFKSYPRLTFQSWSSYQINQLGSEAASDSTLKQLTTCGVSTTCTFFTIQKPSSARFMVKVRCSTQVSRTENGFPEVGRGAEPQQFGHCSLAYNMCAQGRHFNFFLGGQIFLYFSMPPDYWKIGKNSTLYVVIWCYS